MVWLNSDVAWCSHDIVGYLKMFAWLMDIMTNAYSMGYLTMLSRLSSKACMIFATLSQESVTRGSTRLSCLVWSLMTMSSSGPTWVLMGHPWTLRVQSLIPQSIDNNLIGFPNCFWTITVMCHTALLEMTCTHCACGWWSPTHIATWIWSRQSSTTVSCTYWAVENVFSILSHCFRHFLMAMQQ